MKASASDNQDNAVASFVKRWAEASASERANSQPFLCELCDLLGVEKPDPSPKRGYAFEFVVPQLHPDGSSTEGRIDLYKRGCFVLESKQFQAKQEAPTRLEVAVGAEKKKKSGPVRGTEKWDDAMFRAKGQAERYVRSLSAAEANPPFLLVIDVGDTFEIFADFTQAGKAYLPFPDPRTFRLRLTDLGREEIRERLRTIWTDPLSLDPARRSAAVTREIAGHLADLARSLEEAGHPAQTVAEFLTRCLFCMFAEDVGLIPNRSFTELLNGLPDSGEGFEVVMRQLFREMDTGTGKDVSIVLRKKLLRFNGGLFAKDTVLSVTQQQLALLRLAARQNWKNVEPAIFGTLLERALNPEERHKLGAHYTPRAYVERLVLPTVIEPLRTEWRHIRAAAVTLARGGKVQQARKEILEFHRKLCEIRVLDPACGCGNFLYVSLEHLKRLEGEVLDLAATFGETLLLEISTHAVDPHQFLGIEVNPRAAAITELVLWIGYLQWHFRTRGQTMPSEPVLQRFQNIECRDAVLAWDGEPQPATNENGSVKTTWDRRSVKRDPVTGRDVPDETKRVPLLTYTNAKPAQWPMADFIVGNPPFLGPARMRDALGDGYAVTLREAYPSVAESADFVMYWWYKGAECVRNGKAKRFGFITTNSLRQNFNRRVVQTQLGGNPALSLVFAIPDHPWVDTADGAAVRIAMTTGSAGAHSGELAEVTKEEPQSDGSAYVSFATKQGKIQADLTIGADVIGSVQLEANKLLSSEGVKPHGMGFVVTQSEAQQLGLGTAPGLQHYIKPYRNGRDLTDRPRDAWIIDLHGLGIKEVMTKFPAVYQHVLTMVKPERDQNNEAYRRENWWLFGRKNTELRNALAGLRRYIATVKTAKHRVFQFLDAGTVPDSKLIVFAVEDAFHLGILSSRIHCAWALAAGSWLGVGNDPTYVKSSSFEKFPFPVVANADQTRISKLAEELDQHRKRVQAQNPTITLTGMYNVLEKLRQGEPLNAKEKNTHDLGLVSVLKQLHDDLDTAVSNAYGWSTTLTDGEILEKVVELNAKRAMEEENGTIRWLRPEYQNPAGKNQQKQIPGLTTEQDNEREEEKRKRAWPKSLAERVEAVEGELRRMGGPATVTAITNRFTRAKADTVEEILETLCTLGHAKKEPGNTFRA